MATVSRDVYENGVLVRTETMTTTPEQDNAEAISNALEDAITFFTGNYQNWPTMTAAQKDAANRNAQRALARIARVMRGNFSGS